MGTLNAGLDENKINGTTENFMKNKHGMHIAADKIHTTMNKRTRAIDTVNKNHAHGNHTPLDHHTNQQIVDYDNASDSSYIHIPQFHTDQNLKKLKSGLENGGYSNNGKGSSGMGRDMPSQ